MARLKARSIDRNRLSKKYPFVRAPSRTTFFGDSDMVIELITMNFSNESSKTAKFDVPFTDTSYRVAISPRDTGGDSANVSLYVDNTLTDVGQVTIASSAAFTGIVDVIIIRISS